MLTLPEPWSPSCAREPRVPLLGLPGHSQQLHDPVELAERLSQFLPVRSCDPVGRVSAATPFRCHAGALQLGPLGIVALWGTGLHGEVEGSDQATLVIPYRGLGHFRIERRSLSNHTGRTLLLVPPGPWRTDNDVLGGMTIHVDPARLQAVAQAMEGPQGEAWRWHGLGHAPRVLPVRQPDDARRFARLYRLMAFLHGLVRRHGRVPEALRLDDLLLRQMVELLAPAQLADAAEADPPGSVYGLDPLLDWMHAHCHEPLSLTDLERRSHYSRRSLQYAFRERFGCGPMQYLRRQRLWLARQRLERPEPGLTLGHVAACCGYLSVASFRRDFRSRFGIVPSALLGRGQGRAGGVRAGRAPR